MRQMQTAIGSHIPYASGRILAERFLFTKKVSTKCTTFLVNKKQTAVLLQQPELLSESFILPHPHISEY